VRRLRHLAGVAVLAVLAACSTGVVPPPTGTPEPDRFLFERGTEALNNHRWYVAREYFRRLVDGYPQSRFRADAKLGIGDTFLGERTPESYVLAANEYREFLQYYPTHIRADYAQYKLGLTYFQQMRSAERDQTETRDAVRELTTFVERYPNSSLMPEAREKLQLAKDRLSEAAYRVGVFYWRAHWYPGAVDRFKQIMQENPTYTGRDAVYFHLADALEHSSRPAEALPYYDKLLSEFEKSDYLEEAQKRVAALKAQLGTSAATPAAPATGAATEEAPAKPAAEPGSPNAGDKADGGATDGKKAPPPKTGRTGV
jgi:outer membrane protein assembly factor BamD